ncbi:copper chaperone PCu(A)C [Altericroceibacterium endophyticum]|uniref:Copper chaperone PCu(A)C n=1 Tax=Altericroceibacterium endophyticum TaxID=1808508 RepID=A0A6I4TAD7_9SPHN|nr:copper chaperone PCu(A)C [Altericroceibacterium endophyticum]MXO66725.1 copper chaperone PCu(A)C [Altericroceibacterium endophyticum]
MQFKTTRPLGRRIHAGIAAVGTAALILSIGACSSETQPDNTASESATSEIAITASWSRETAEGQDAGGAFMTIANTGPGSDRLIGGSTPVAGDVQVHTVDMTGGVMRMRQLQDGLEIPAGGTVTLRPGSFHIMLMGLKHPLEQGETVPLTLTFAKAGPVEVELAVEPVGSQGPNEAGGSDD